MIVCKVLQEGQLNDARSLSEIEAEMQTAHTNFPQGVSTGRSTMQAHILHVRSSRGTEVDGKNREGEREMADFHDSDVLRRIPLAID